MVTNPVVLVDKKDTEIGQSDIIHAHKGIGQRHRAISLFLFNKNGELLLQQRSHKKLIGAGQWANTCCGHVLPKETSLNCAKRKLKQELGISDILLTPLYKFEYHIKCDKNYSEWEIDQVFIGKYDGPIKPNTKEVQSYQWQKFTPWFLKMLTHQKLLKYL